MRESAQAACAGDDGKRRNRHTILKQAAAGIKKFQWIFQILTEMIWTSFLIYQSREKQTKNTIFQNVKKKY